MKDIATVVSGDPGLAVHLLKYANSPIFRFERKIESLEKAIQVIGAKAVYEFALVFGITNMLSNDHSKYIDVNKFWMQSILCGLYGVFFSKKCKEKDVARLYTSGLLHNVGELAVLRVSPTLVSDCNKFKSDAMPKQCQDEILGFSFAEVSASLLQQWLIPDALVSTVAMQHHDDAPAVTKESQIMQLSYTLALINTYPDYFSIEQHLPSFLYSSLQLEIEALEEAQENCQDEYEALASIFKMSFSEPA
jgi:HD-like signal output (HDOD) protein